MSSEFVSNYLHGESFLGESAKDLIEGEFDVVVMTSSWDRRCASLTSCDSIKAKYSLLLLFDTRDNLGLRDKHDLHLKTYLNLICSENPKLVKGRSEDVEVMWGNIFMNILKIRQLVSRPLNILIDLSACPRYYALAMLGGCIRSGIAAQITFFYAEGVYESPKEKLEVIEFSFTQGKWKTVPVPFLDGSYVPEKEKFYLVSVGFEGAKTMRVLNKEDPDRVSLLFPDPGTHPGYVEKTEAINRSIIEEFKIPPEQIVRAKAGDAINAWKKLSENNLERENENIHYLCCGTKPHALGQALRAISLGHPSVLYNVPESHTVTSIYPSGQYWRFTISDLSSL